MPFLVLVALFIGIPILEISLLIKVSSAIGGFKTILFVIFTAVLGAYLVKQQGLATYMRFQQEANAGRIPAQQMLEGLALLLAGAVLLTPGFFTDAIGFALLVPPIRQWAIRSFLSRAVVVQSQNSAFYGQQDTSSGQRDTSARHGSVIEGEYTDNHKQD